MKTNKFVIILLFIYYEKQTAYDTVYALDFYSNMLINFCYLKFLKFVSNNTNHLDEISLILFIFWFCFIIFFFKSICNQSNCCLIL